MDWLVLYIKLLLGVGCWFCNKKRMSELKQLYKEYPELWNELKKIEKDSFNKFKRDYTLEDLERKFKNG